MAIYIYRVTNRESSSSDIFQLYMQPCKLVSCRTLYCRPIHNVRTPAAL